MVGHHAKSFQHPSALLTGLKEAFLEGLMRPIIYKQILTVIPTIDHMVNPIAAFNA